MSASPVPSPVAKRFHLESLDKSVSRELSEDGAEVYEVQHGHRPMAELIVGEASLVADTQRQLYWIRRTE